MRLELGDELQTTIDNLTAEHERSIEHLKAEAVRTYEPQIRGLEVKAELLEVELRTALARHEAETWIVAGALGGIFLLELILSPGWDDVLPLLGAGAWLGWRLVLE